ncbi:MAG: exonuclease domain-containing protein [Ancrocorticia populi]|uniref:3'-5' exonuclease n=1 Tax=Ancrocorticia populi TaxID=2175228 RepID=UPI003F902EB0
MRRGYAVLDFETTGFSPKCGDRVLEIGASYLSPELALSDCFETLVNPMRDVGPTRIHGITASDVYDAPTFEEVAPQLLDLIEGCVLVGHNISFDLRFLEAELTRAGYIVPEFVAIDTMKLSRRLLPDMPSHKLADVAERFELSVGELCRSLSIDEHAAHSALGDVIVTAFALGGFVGMASESKYWINALDQAAALSWPAHALGCQKLKVRGQGGIAGGAQAGPPSPYSLADVITASHQSYAVSNGDVAQYSQMIDSVLDDRVVDEHELAELVARARELNLDSSRLDAIHRGYLDGVIERAWNDGILTNAELEDIGKVAELVGLDPQTVMVAAKAQADSGGPALPVGSIIVLTGDMTKPRAEIEAALIAHGFLPGKGVTKKTALVIAADDKTMSSKAKKARQYNIPVVSETEGLQLLGL